LEKLVESEYSLLQEEGKHPEQVTNLLKATFKKVKEKKTSLNKKRSYDDLLDTQHNLLLHDTQSLDKEQLKVMCCNVILMFRRFILII